MADLAKTYAPLEVEERRYAWWLEHGWFWANADDARPPASITIPPPNVTGTLHMGHALQHAIHDTLARWARMRGYNVCVVPRVDHAGIGTQIKVSQYLHATEGKHPQEIGRERWLEQAHEWAAHNGGGILRQLPALGFSYDWRRERYPLDDGYYHAVLTAFKRFYDKGWIYRGERMVNWCPTCKTVISDLEVEQHEVHSHLWAIKYPGLDGAPDIVVSTTRPETMLGDTAVAVNPQDPRWQAAIGQMVNLPLMDRPIPIVGDDYVDLEFGSGALKVTPGHDVNDWEIGQRHGLEVVVVIGQDGLITGAGGKYAGMDRFEARQAVLADLEAQGLLVKVEDYHHTVPHHDRCHTVIEPLPMEQWFMAMRELADAALPWYRSGAIQFHPDRFREYGIEWLENIRDWCISRQLWWGHRIPIYYGAKSGKVVCALSEEEAAAAFDGEPYDQESDVLDTWFSSALWPFAVLGWPDAEQYAYLGQGTGATDAGSLDAFHPTEWMITGRDILYLWVARMAMTAKEFTGEVPFRHVVVHPTIQTKDGQRMSRSLGTGIDPLELIAAYGADATRMMLLMQCSTTQDIRFDAEVKDNQLESSVTADTCRNFLNKIWNASRFVLMNLGDERPGPLPAALETADQWILSRLNQTIATVTEALEQYRFDEVCRTLYEFIWTEFCDWYIELTKPRLRAGEPGVKAVLWHVLETTMRLLHPVAPFLSEEIWQQLGADGEACIVAAWPTCDAGRLQPAVEAEFAALQAIVRAIRNLRVEAGVPDKQAVEAVLQFADASGAEALRPLEGDLRAAANVSAVCFSGAGEAAPEKALVAVLDGVSVFVPLSGLVDVEAERARLSKEREKAAADLAAQHQKLGNEAFVGKAPEAVVQKVRDRAAELAEQIDRLDERIASLD